MATLILSHDLANRQGIFIEGGKSKFDALVEVVRDEKHSVKTLMEAILKGWFGRETAICGCKQALIVKNQFEK